MVDFSLILLQRLLAYCVIYSAFIVFCSRLFTPCETATDLNCHFCLVEHLLDEIIDEEDKTRFDYMHAVFSRFSRFSVQWRVCAVVSGSSSRARYFKTIIDRRSTKTYEFTCVFVIYPFP